MEEKLELPMNADFFFSFSLTNKQNYRCTQPRTCIKLVMRNLGRLSRMKNAFFKYFFFKLPKIFGEEEESEDWHQEKKCGQLHFFFV